MKQTGEKQQNEGNRILFYNMMRREGKKIKKADVWGGKRGKT